MDRGDIFHVNLDPIVGREQAGARYVLIVSTKAFNILGTPLICPITQGGNFARHAGFAASRLTIKRCRLVLFTTKSSKSAYAFDFMPDDVLLFGKESAGVPSAVAHSCDARLRIPTRPQVRSLNLAMTAALALGEALRQTATLPT